MTVGLVVVSHSARLAEGVVELAGQMTQGKASLVAAGGAGEDGYNVLGTSVDKILAAIQFLDGPDGVLVLLDLGSAILSAEMALEFLEEQQQARVILSYAPLVEGTVAAALEASLGHTLLQVKQAAERTAHVEQLLQLKPVSQSVDPLADPLAGIASALLTAEVATQTIEMQLTLANPAGLHARPAGLFVQTAARFRAHIQVVLRGREADASSIMAVLGLGARQDDTLTLRASGPEAELALEALRQLVQANFHEVASSSPTAQSTALRTSVEPQSALRTSVEPQSALHPRPATHEAWQGMPTSHGVALGPAFLYTSNRIALSAVPARAITAQEVVAEQAHLLQALAAAAQELSTLAIQVKRDVGQAEAGIFEAQALMLYDPFFVASSQKMIEQQLCDAATALARVGEEQAVTLETLDNDLLAARAVDIRDAVSRVVRFLGRAEIQQQDLSAFHQPVILVAHDLTPSDTARLRPASVLGICTVQGGPTAHVAILARALGIPALAGLSEAALLTIRSGDELALDAEHGLLYHHPTAEVHERFAALLAQQQERQAAHKLAAQQVQVPVTFNGRCIHLLANVASEAEAEASRQWGAEGIGLLRTEFLFAAAVTLPSEDEQCARYAQVFRAFKGHATQAAGPIVVRTLDAGADKPMPALDSILGSAREANPALGLRGIRIHLAHQELLKQQISALLRAAAEVDVQLHIMFPMITTVEELCTARAIFDQVYATLQQKGIVVPAHVPVGIMIEVPAAAIMAAELAEYADFFSIGANDLLQYTVAADRTNAATAYLYHAMQPAVLRLMRHVAEVGQRAGKPVAVCGEIAGDMRLAPILVGLGVDELSMAPMSLPQVRSALNAIPAQRLLDAVATIGHLRTVAEIEQVVIKNW